MKQKLSLLFACSFFTILLLAQKQAFDIATYSLPKGWSKQSSASAVQLSKEDPSGTYCLITLYKSLPAGDDAKKNFDASWESLAKDQLDIKADPEMQPQVTEDGWQVQSGHATFEKDEVKGIALLVSSTGYDKLVNVLILTNTDAYEKDITAFLESIDLKKPAANNTKPNTGNVKPPANTNNSPTSSTPAIKTQFKFNTTNFDDGWNATEQEDWVEVTKGNIKVLLHYPKEGTVFAADPAPLTNAAWNILVAPHYSNLKNYRVAYISDYERGYIATGDLTDSKTGKQVFVTFFRKGNTGWIEIVTPDKNSFINEFKFDPTTVDFNTENATVAPLIKLPGYNRFAIAASDFTGTWKDNFASNTYYTNIYTGTSAGMSTYTSSQTFVFNSNQTYKWDLIMANSYGGTSKFAKADGAGTFKVLNNWQIYFSKMEGKPKTYDAYFSCVKGGRILWMNDTNYKGSGIFTGFTKQQ